MRVRIQDDAGHFRSWEVVDQTNLFVEVIDGAGRADCIGSLWFDKQVDGSWNAVWGTTLNDQEWWEQTSLVRFREPKTEILIHAWDGPTSGFDWEPASDRAYTMLRNNYENDVARGIYSHVVFAKIRVAGWNNDSADRDSISEFIEGELQDAITLGRVGRIIARHSLEGRA